MVKNLVDIDLLKTKLGPVLNINPLTGDPTYFAYHPFLTLYAYAPFFKLFGATPLISRVISLVIFQLGTVVLYKTAADMWNKNIALTAAFFYALFPCSIYFGKMFLPEVLLSTISLVFVWFYSKWVKSERPLFYWGMLATYALGCNMEWPGYFLAAAAILHYRYALGMKNKKIYGLLGVGAVSFVIFFLHMRYLTGSFSGAQTQWPEQFSASVDGVFSHAINVRFKPLQLFNSEFYQRLLFDYAFKGFTFPAVLAASWLIFHRSTMSLKSLIWLVPAFAGAMWTLLFPYVFYGHFYYVAYFSSLMAIACSLFFHRLPVWGRCVFLAAFLPLAALHVRGLHAANNSWPQHIMLGRAISSLAKPGASLATTDAFSSPFIDYYADGRGMLYDVDSWDKLNYVIKSGRIRYVSSYVLAYNEFLSARYPYVTLPFGYKLFDLSGKGWSPAAKIGFIDSFTWWGSTDGDYLNLSQEEYNSGDYNACVAYSRRALQLNPKMAAAYNNMGVAFIQLGLYDDAIAACGKALALDPGSQLAKNNLAWAMSKPHKPLKAGR